MINRKIAFFSLSLLLVISAGIFWLTTQQTEATTERSRVPHPLDTINEKSRIAKSGDFESAKSLTQEIILVAGFENELRGFASSRISDRVANAESRYQQGISEGIPESRVVGTINDLAVKFNLPEFAKTNSYEVRKLRVTLFPNFPQLISLGTGSGKAVSAGDKVSPNMSPAEAYFVLSMMIQQKMANPSYQMTRQEQLKYWDVIHNERGDSQKSKLDFTENRSKELKDAIERSAKSSSVADMWQLTDSTLNTLGIEQL